MDPREDASEQAENMERLNRLRAMRGAPLQHIDEMQRVLVELEPFVTSGRFREGDAEEVVTWARSFLDSAPRR